MEKTSLQPSAPGVSKTAFWSGWIISTLNILFLLVDAVMKIIMESHAVEGSKALGWAEQAISATGITLLICTVLYAIPKTSIPGAVLLTGYLGGAIATMIHAGQQMYFALGFGIMVWLGLYLRDRRTRSFLFNTKN